MELIVMRILRLSLISLFILATGCVGTAQRTTFVFQNHKPSNLVLPIGWKFVQDTWVACQSGFSTCTVPSDCSSTDTCIIPTTAGTIWIASIYTGNTNITISSIGSSSGSWQTCTCHIFNSGHDDMDAMVNFTGTTGSTSFVVNVSGATTRNFQVNFIELLPPAGYTASLDASAVTSSGSCATCTGVALTLTATDALVQLIDPWDAYIDWNGFSSPYFTDFTPNGIALNTNSGTAPTLVQSAVQGGTTPSYQSFIGLAFKSTAGTFTVTNNKFTLANFAVPENGSSTTCSPTCTETIPSTGSGRLLFLVEGNETSGGPALSSVTGCGTWVVSSSCKVVGAQGDHNISCAYNLSSTSSCTSISITYSATANFAAFEYWEVARSSGSFSVDSIAGTSNGATANGRFSGQALTITGTDDVVFQANAAGGGTNMPNLYPYNYNEPGHSGGVFLSSNYAAVMGLDMASVPAPVWIHPQENGVTTGVFAAAFK